MEIIRKELWTIWKDEQPRYPELAWRMQCVGYIAQFPSQEAAEKYRDSTKAARARQEALKHATKFVEFNG